jgi:tetratricopeptide (TPR) repeat protein
MVKYLSRPLVLIAISISIFLLIDNNQLQQLIKVNWAKVVLVKAWFSVDDIGSSENDLKDGIPDHWKVANWGQARSSIGRDDAYYFLEPPSILIKKNNDSDTSLLFQEIAIKPKEEVICVVYHRGGDAFFRILAEGMIGQSIIMLPHTDDWLASSLTFFLESGYETAIVLFGITGLRGEAWFDQVECNYSEMRTDNLIVNGDFKLDGGNEISAELWFGSLSHKPLDKDFERALEILVTYSFSESPLHVNLLNAADILLGRGEQIVRRMEDVSTGCIGVDGNPSLMLSLASWLRDENNLAASERVAQLAIDLMPSCPQSYAWLGSLYWSVNAYQQAANLYQEAVLRSLPGAQKGAYLFEQGRIYVNGTGDYKNAIEVLTQAEENEGWERSPWYRGATLIELGNAYFEEGRCSDAQAAYQKVIDCQECSVRHSSAILGLQNLNSCVP